MTARHALKAEIAAGPDLLDRTRFSLANRKRLSAPGLRTFLAIADLWALTDDERMRVLGLPARSTYYNWAKAAREHRDIALDVDVLTRISAVFGIHQALGVLHADERSAVTWLRTPHQGLAFGGLRPLDLLTCGTQDGLMTVRRFLDAARGGLYMPPNQLDEVFTPYSDEDIVIR